MVATQEALDSFADIVIAVEYFMQAVTEGRGIQPEIIEVAQAAMAKLSLPPLDDEGSDEAANLESIDGGEAVIEDDKAVLEEGATAEEEVGLEQQYVKEYNPLPEDIDSEILDIFLEESKEELAVIQEYLPRWKRDHDDIDALTIFRRSFHTLKGSGRLVGAATIGEFAWSVENLLNRIIDETIEVSPAVLALLDEPLEILPVLIEAQESGQTPVIDVQPTMDRAFAWQTPMRSLRSWLKRVTQAAKVRLLNWQMRLMCCSFPVFIALMLMRWSRSPP